MLPIPLAVLNLLALVTLSGALAVIAAELPRLRRALIDHRRREQPISDLVSRLCDRNQLVRLAAIHGLGQTACDRPDTRARVAAVLAAYLRAMTRDPELRRLAQTEIRECLRELSTLNAAGTLALDLSGCDFSGLALDGLNLDRADLRHCNLSDCDVRNLSLRGALLGDAMFSRARISGLDLRQAQVGNIVWDGAQLENMRGVSAEQVQRWQEQADSWGKAGGIASSIFARMDMPVADKSKLH
jgi:hypothetical protein